MPYPRSPLPWPLVRFVAPREPSPRRPKSRRSRGFLASAALAVLFLSACSGSSLIPPTQTPGAIPSALSTDTTENRPTSSPSASATNVPASSPVPPTATAAPSSGVSFQPAQLAQGGIAVVYLNETAVNATLSFGGRQYPMLQSGDRWWAIIGIGAFAEPGLAPVTIAYTPSAGAAPRTITQSIAIADRNFPVEYIELAPATAALLAPEIVNNEIDQRAAIYSGYTTQKLWNGPFRRPAGGELSSLYGEGRSYNGAPVTDYHRGTDFLGGIGDPVYGAAAGRVVFTGELKVRGNAIMIDHGAGVFSAYHHLSAIEVKAGDIVTPGQRIGAIGSTGLATGPHLHWEVIVRGVEVDGLLWLAGAPIGP